MADAASPPRMLTPRGRLGREAVDFDSTSMDNDTSTTTVINTTTITAAAVWASRFGDNQSRLAVLEANLFREQAQPSSWEKSLRESCRVSSCLLLGTPHSWLIHQPRPPRCYGRFTKVSPPPTISFSAQHQNTPHPDTWHPHTTKAASS